MVKDDPTGGGELAELTGKMTVSIEGASTASISNFNCLRDGSSPRSICLEEIMGDENAKVLT